MNKFKKFKASWGFNCTKDSGFLQHLARHFLAMSDVVAAVGGPVSDRDILQTRAILAARYAARREQIGL